MIKEIYSKKNTWEPRKNLGNIQELVNQFKYDKGVEQIKKKNIRENEKGELPRKYMVKILYKQDNCHSPL